MHPKASVALMKFLSDAAKRLGVGGFAYVVGGAVRNYVLGVPIKDIDLVIDPTVEPGKDSAWFAKQLQRFIPVPTSLVTNNYGVAILSVDGPWVLDGYDLDGEKIEIANARSESYSEGGYKPDQVNPATIEEDVYRREFTSNTLLWRLNDLARGPDKAEILDLTGCGLRDLKQGVMACPRDPDVVFADDPSRMIRAVKFTIKYGFKIPSDLEASIRRNAPRLHQIPSAHISNMLIETFLRDSSGKKALLEMKRLGLLDVIREIAVKDKSFRQALANWAESEASVAFLFDLMDLGLPVGKKLLFLSPEDFQRAREVTFFMDPSQANDFVLALKQPGRLLDLPALIQEFDLKGPGIQTLTEAVRRALLESPDLMDDVRGLENRVRQNLVSRRVARRILAAGRPYFMVGDMISYGKYKNHIGVVRGFGRDNHGNPTVIFDPVPKGRKKTKEVGLYRIWRYPKPNEAEAQKQKLPVASGSPLSTRPDYGSSGLTRSASVRLAGLQSDLQSRMERLLREFTAQEAEAVGAWFAKTFRVQSPKTPRGQKSLKDQAEKLRWWLVSGKMSSAEAQRKEIALVWGELEPQVANLVRYFSDEGGTVVPAEMKIGSRVYLNKIGFDQDKFSQYVTSLERLFDSVQGWRKGAFIGTLKIALAGPKDFRGTAGGVYKSAEDTLYVRATPAVLARSSGSYGALDYILIHELGHRYERNSRPPEDFDKSDWWTSAYSRKEGESFAELFALGHFKMFRDARGSWSPAIQERFEATMKGQPPPRELPDHLKKLIQRGGLR